MATLTKDRDIRVHNGVVAWRHIESEYLDVVEDILDTLVPEGPYAYTVSPHAVNPDAPPTVRDGSIPHQALISTKEELRASYENLHRFTAVRGMEAIAEIRGDWYSFMYGLGEGYVKYNGSIVYSPTALLFPTMGKEGITGELFWTRTSAGDYYTGGREGPLASQTAVLARQKELIDALSQGDVAAIVALFHPDAQTGIRDYVNETGTLVGLNGRAELEEYLHQFFGRFRVLDLSVVQRLVGDWYVFVELLWTVEETKRGGHYSFYTAEFGEIRPDGSFASRIGHGTDPKPL